MTTATLPRETREALREAFRTRARQWISRLYRHELLVARSVRGLQVEVVDRFNRDIVRPMLQVVAGRLATFDLRGNDIVVEAFPQLRQLEREIQQIAGQGSDAVRRLSAERMKAIAESETAWMASTAQNALKVDVPTMDAGRSFAAAEVKPVLGQKTEEWFRTMLAEPTAKNVRAWVQTGVQRGLTTDEIVRGLKGSPESPGVLTQTKAAVATMVRTSASHVLNQTRMDNLKALGVEEVQFVATLDERTSITCASQDGKVYPIGEGPVPPLHPNCRSTVVPYFGETKGATRASVEGPVPADVSFRKWLHTQSSDTQDAILGKSRATAWRSGKLSFDRMIGTDLQPITVAELRRRDLIPTEDE